METKDFDTVTRDLATETTRRRAIVGLGALVLAGAGALASARDAAANQHERCIERCVSHRGEGANVRKKRDRCRRQCAGR